MNMNMAVILFLLSLGDVTCDSGGFGSPPTDFYRHGPSKSFGTIDQYIIPKDITTSIAVKGQMAILNFICKKGERICSRPKDAKLYFLGKNGKSVLIHDNRKNFIDKNFKGGYGVYAGGKRYEYDIENTDVELHTHDYTLQIIPANLPESYIENIRKFLHIIEVHALICNKKRTLCIQNAEIANYQFPPGDYTAFCVVKALHYRISQLSFMRWEGVLNIPSFRDTMISDMATYYNFQDFVLQASDKPKLFDCGIVFRGFPYTYANLEVKVAK